MSANAITYGHSCYSTSDSTTIHCYDTDNSNADTSVVFKKVFVVLIEVKSEVLQVVILAEKSI